MIQYMDLTFLIHISLMYASRLYIFIYVFTNSDNLELDNKPIRKINTTISYNKLCLNIDNKIHEAFQIYRHRAFNMK